MIVERSGRVRRGRKRERERERERGRKGGEMKIESNSFHGVCSMYS